MKGGNSPLVGASVPAAIRGKTAVFVSVITSAPEEHDRLGLGVGVGDGVGDGDGDGKTGEL